MAGCSNISYVLYYFCSFLFNSTSTQEKENEAKKFFKGILKFPATRWKIRERKGKGYLKYF
jgi:hypothetical protein